MTEGESGECRWRASGRFIESARRRGKLFRYPGWDGTIHRFTVDGTNIPLFHHG